jgi:hypothetical protein
MSLHSDTLSCFAANQSLLFLINVGCLAEKQQIPILSINNSRFAEFLPLIYPPELEVKETTDAASSVSFLDLCLEFDDSGQLSTNIYDKRDDFNFKIINIPNMCSNILVSPAYGVYISQLIRYARASSNYSDFLKRHLHLRNRLLDQGY